MSHWLGKERRGEAWRGKARQVRRDTALPVKQRCRSFMALAHGFVVCFFSRRKHRTVLSF